VPDIGKLQVSNPGSKIKALPVENKSLLTAVQEPKRHNFHQASRGVNYCPSSDLANCPLTFRGELHDPYGLSKREGHDRFQELWVKLGFSAPHKLPESGARCYEVANDGIFLRRQINKTTQFKKRWCQSVDCIRRIKHFFR
jgi:hypothetical protein